MKKILIITNESDPLQNEIFHKYLSKDYQFIIFNIDLVQQNILTVSEYYFELNGLKIEISSINLIWYRRFTFLESDSILKSLINAQQLEINTALFMYTEYKQLLLGLLHLLKNIPTINGIDLFYSGNYKVSNFSKAVEFGFNIPSSIVSNDISKIKEFGNTHTWNIILKTFFTVTYQKDDIEFYVPVKKINYIDIHNSQESIKTFPIYLQQYIEKEYELRIVVIGKEIFPFAIYSQDEESAKIDFRINDLSKLKHELVEIPNSLTNSILKYIDFYKIDIGSFDIVYTPDNIYYFLECNLDGEWFWLEQITGINLTDKIWKLILKKF